MCVCVSIYTLLILDFNCQLNPIKGRKHNHILIFNLFNNKILLSEKMMSTRDE